MNINTEFPNPRDLICFEEIARTESLSRAALRLGVGQPGLSLVVKRLESSLGTALFIRQSRGLSLTPAGRRLLARCMQLRESWSTLLAETKNASVELSGKFTIGCHTAVAQYCLNPFVRDFYRRFPRIEFALEHGPSKAMGEAVISGRLDFAFVANPLRHPNLVIKKLASDNFAIWAKPSHLADVLILDPNLAQSQALSKKLGALRFRRFVHSESLEVVASLAESGAGAALLPERVVRALAPSLRLLNEFGALKDEIAFIYRYDIPKSAAVSAVIAAAKSLEI